MNKLTAFAFDLDGTIYNGSRAVSGAAGAIGHLTGLGYKVFYFTNNSAKTRGEIIEKLDHLGFCASEQNTYCTAHALALYLSEIKPKSVYVIGSSGLRRELSSRKIKIKDTPRVSAVVVGLDHDFDYRKVSIALEAIRRGAKLYVANTDPSYPVENNLRLPGCGAMVGAIVAASGHRPDFNAGKPNTYMMELLCREHKIAPKDICIIGDSPESDILMAKKFGCQSILFDPQDNFRKFPGKRIKKHCEIISLIRKERGCR
jgi:4-nitrophenyl phosphatase